MRSALPVVRCIQLDKVHLATPRRSLFRVFATIGGRVPFASQVCHFHNPWDILRYVSKPWMLHHGSFRALLLLLVWRPKIQRWTNMMLGYSWGILKTLSLMENYPSSSMIFPLKHVIYDIPMFSHVLPITGFIGCVSDTKHCSIRISYPTTHSLRAAVEDDFASGTWGTLERRLGARVPEKNVVNPVMNPNSLRCLSKQKCKPSQA